MPAPGFPKLFARYAATVARRIGPGVKLWDTINEPTVLIFGYLKPWWQKEYFFPPGSPTDIPMGRQIEQLGKLIRNLFLAHAAGRREILKVNPQALVGTNPAMLGLPRWVTSLLDWIMTRVSSEKRLHRNLARIAERGFVVRKNVDLVLGALTRTAGREQKIDFSDGYLETGFALLTAAETGAASREPRRIAVVKSSTGEAAARRAQPAARVVRFPTAKSALSALDAGAVDGVMTDTILADAIVKQFPDRYRTAQRIETSDVYAAGVRKGSAEWLRVVNGAIRDFTQSGELRKSVLRHLGTGTGAGAAAGAGAGARTSGARKSRGARTAEAPGLESARPHSELRAIRRRGHLVVAVRDDVPGLCFRDRGTGQWSGVEVDIARAVAARVFADPDRVRFRKVRTSRRVPLLRSFFSIFDPIIRTITILTSVANSNWWHLGMAGRLDPFLCPPGCAGQMDYAGFDYYWGVSSLRLRRMGALFDALMRGQYLEAPVWPGGLGAKLGYLSRLFPRTPIVILENGCVVRADGMTREEYLRRHVAQVVRGRRAGINVMGYLCWSITTNRELGAAFDDQSDFGLFRVELDTDPALKRKATPSARVYKELIAEERRREAVEKGSQRPGGKPHFEDRPDGLSGQDRD